MGNAADQHAMTKPLRIGVLLEERFQRLPNGRLFSPGGFGNETWARYLRAFGRVTVVARVEAAASAEPSWAEVTLPEVEILPIAPYIGPVSLMRQMPKVLRSFRHATRCIDAMIIRAPGTLAILAAFNLRRRPFAVEVVGDPVDVFGAGIGGRFGPILSLVFVRNLKWLCANADGVSYVTRETLQRRYPAQFGAISNSVSDVQLPQGVFAPAPRPVADRKDPSIFCAASLEVPYKGIDVLLDALSGMSVAPRLRLAGEGRLRPELEAHVERAGLNGRVTFLGRLSKEEVLNEMRRCDIYVQPSLTEGLPRAVIEAMATAAPVVSTNVGGLPELVRPEDMVPPGDASALAALLENVLIDPERLRAMSRHSLDVARDYEATILDERRNRFYADWRARAEGVQV